MNDKITQERYLEKIKKQVLSLFDAYKQKLNKDDYYIRALVATYLFDFLDRLRLNNFPKNWYDILEKDLRQISEYADFLKDSFDLSKNNFDSWNDDNNEKNIELKTGKFYFNLWKKFTNEEYFEQATEYIKERFEKNDITVNDMDYVLDDGCGGGRYTIGLKNLGFKKIVGLDISQDAIDFAKKMNPYPEEVSFIQGSALDLPFEDETFDFVFCNGVLHHTTDTEKGIKEIYRVLKPNGKCWLYIYGGKGSLFWDIVDFAREILGEVPISYTYDFMQLRGYPPGRIFHRLDFFYVPSHKRYYISEMEKMLKDAGFSNYRKLKRGVVFDWDEIIYNNPDIDPYVYSLEGEMRYLIEK